MESKNDSFEEKENFLITSITNIKKTPRNSAKKSKININETTTPTMNSKISFPKLNYKTTFPNQRNNYSKLRTNYSNNTKNKKKKPKIEIGLKKLELFIHPINRSVLEIKGIRALKENLVKKRFNDLHRYKLQINPDNYYHTYGLNKFIIITNSNSNNKRNKSFNYQFNNVSSYNNILLKEDEDKININMNYNKNKLYKNIKINNYKNNISLLKNVPCKLKNRKCNDYIINSFNEEKQLVNTNCLWRGRNINELINNKTNLNFFRNFIKNSKNIGKIKAIE